MSYNWRVRAGGRNWKETNGNIATLSSSVYGTLKPSSSPLTNLALESQETCSMIWNSGGLRFHLNQSLTFLLRKWHSWAVRYKSFTVCREIEGNMATGTITCKGKGGGAAVQSLGGWAGWSVAQRLGDSAMLWPPAASAPPCTAAAGTGGLFPDPVFSPISI